MEEFVAELEAAVKQAHEAGGFTAVLSLAERRRLELQSEFFKLIQGHKVRRMSNLEREKLRPTWTPEKAQLNDRIVELDWRIRQWSYVEDHSRVYADNEALGWTVQPDGSYTKTLEDGTTIGCKGSTTIVHQEDRRRVARTVTRPAQRRTSGHRPRGRRSQAARRAAGTRSGSDPGDPDDGESPAAAILRVRRPSGIVQTFEADDLERDDGILWATGRWRRRVGLNYAEIRYSPIATYGFGAGEILEVRL